MQTTPSTPQPVIIGRTNKPYVPVDCDLTDNLELYAMHKQHVRILVAENDDGGRQEIRGNVADVVTENHADFVRFEDGRTVRLDRILEIDKL